MAKKKWDHIELEDKVKELDKLFKKFAASTQQNLKNLDSRLGDLEVKVEKLEKRVKHLEK